MEDEVVLLNIPRSCRVTLDTYRNNHEEWGAPYLDLDTYIERENILAHTTWSQNGFRAWILVRRNVFLNAPDKLGLQSAHIIERDASLIDQIIERKDILAACETYDRMSLLSLASNQGNKSNDSHRELSAKVDPDNIFMYSLKTASVASVFVPVPYRGLKYGSTLMRLLYTRLASEGYDASNIHSDVGPLFYSRLGWTAYCSVETILPVPFRKHIDSYRLTQLLLEPELKGIIDMDCHFLRRKLVRCASTPFDKCHFAILPTLDSIDWINERARFYANHENKPILIHWGARIISSSNILSSISDPFIETSSISDFIVWSHDFRDRCLRILRLVSHSNSSRIALLNCAAAQAHLTGLEKIIVWDLPVDINDVAKEWIHDDDSTDPTLSSTKILTAWVDTVGGSSYLRSHSISSLAVFDTSFVSSLVAGKQFVWHGNERYCWV